MGIENLIQKAIPIPPTACWIIRGRLEWQRQQMRERLVQGTDLHLVPAWVVKEWQRYQQKEGG